jgi:hypothetical protein
MRRWFGVGVALLLVLAGVAIGIGAYHAGYNHGLVNSGHVREVVVGPGYGPRYGFPFGFLFFPLFFIGLFLLIRGAFWRRRWAYGGGTEHHHMGPGPWGKGPGGPGGPRDPGGPGMFEEWHRRQHGEGAQDQTGSPPQPVSSA